MIAVVRGLKSESRARSVAVACGLFLASVLTYVFINVTNMKGSFRDFFWFSLALLFCCCGALIGNALFQKNTSSEPNPHKSSFGVEGGHGVCSCKNGARPVFPAGNLAKKASLLDLGDFDPPEDSNSH